MGKLLRARDTESILVALARLDQSSHGEIQRHHRAEHWRDEIIAKGIDAIEAYLSEEVSADRQKLRQLWRNYSGAKTDARKIQLSRLIYKEVFQALAVDH